MNNKRKNFLALFILVNTHITYSLANPLDTSLSETPMYKKATPENFITCHEDRECKVVQGWCSTFAVNKNHLDEYNKIKDPKKESFNQCPPGWLPPNPKAVCIKNQCTVISK